MRQNRSISTSKGQRNKNSNFDNLTNDLMSKIGDLKDQTNVLRPLSSKNTINKKIISHYDDLEILSLVKPSRQSKISEPTSILQKAKLFTRQNQKQIQRAKKLYKKSNPQSDGMFLTGCGLYRAEQPQPSFNEQYEQVDMNDALKYLVSHEKDDLQELRKMIKKTSVNIQEYSHEMNRTKNQVVNAADMFGKQLNTDLRMKINKHRPIENNFCQFIETGPKRKISTGTKQRPKNIF